VQIIERLEVFRRQIEASENVLIVGVGLETLGNLMTEALVLDSPDLLFALREDVCRP
jgi:hypothetical protein